MPQNMPVAENMDYETGRLYDLPLEAISPNPGQPRRSFEPAPLEALKRSIEREGLLQPIAVLRDGNGRFLIAAGERRYRAFRELGRSTIPARIVSGDVEDLSIVEAIAFSQGDLADESPQKLDLLYRPILNDFRGRTAIEAQVAYINTES